MVEIIAIDTHLKAHCFIHEADLGLGSAPAYVI